MINGIQVGHFDSLRLHMLRFALLGCGRIAKKHIEALETLKKKTGRCELVAICDIDQNKVRLLSQQLGVPGFTSLNQMMAEMGESIDIVNILTPSGLHPEHAIAVAQFGKHVVVEKPMALRLQDADDMIRSCDKNGVRLFVVKQNRYNVAVQQLKKALDQGRFGKIVMGTVRVRWCRTQDYYNQAAWRGTWALDGGVFANQASHHVDLLHWLLGDVDSVYAAGRTALSKIETEDTGAAILKFSSGAMGIIEATTATRPKDLEGSLSILGEKGSVEIGGFAVNQVRHWQFVDNTPEDAQIRETAHESPDSVYGFGHVSYLENVIQAIDSGKAALVDGLEGRRSLELINGIYESIETAKEVSLKFKPQMCKLGIQ